MSVAVLDEEGLQYDHFGKVDSARFDGDSVRCEMTWRRAEFDSLSGKHGESLLGMGRAYEAGEDPFEQFVRDGKAALSACIEGGIGSSGKIASYGVSRAGYCLLRLAAADSRVRAVAGLSPVTDWGIPEEFTQTCLRLRALARSPIQTVQRPTHAGRGFRDGQG